LKSLEALRGLVERCRAPLPLMPGEGKRTRGEK